MTHTTRFFRDTSTGEHKAQCSCGWNITGTLAECQIRAAVHDFDIEIKSPVSDDAFHSGLR